jgi:hypothetical protein
MYYHLIDDKRIKKFLAVEGEFESNDSSKIIIDFKQQEGKIFATMFRVASDSGKQKSMLATFLIDDFTCLCHLNPQNPENYDAIFMNGKYPTFHYSKSWHKFLTKELALNKSASKAEDYVEDLLDTNMGDVEEYKNLMEIVENYKGLYK